MLGKVVKSNGHVEYVCQICGQGEISSPPSPDDYAFGTFVRIALPDEASLVGLVYDTILMNPEFGNLGPRLSPPTDLEIFSPDYLREKVVLVGLVAVGQMGADGSVLQGVPRVAADVDATVQKLSEAETKYFHKGTPGPRIAYASFLLAQGQALTPHLLLRVIEQLEELFPRESQSLSVLRSNLAWKAVVTPAG